jgi:hypothetical protein
MKKDDEQNAEQQLALPIRRRVVDPVVHMFTRPESGTRSFVVIGLVAKVSAFGPTEYCEASERPNGDKERQPMVAKESAQRSAFRAHAGRNPVW